jgi:hypothetical protein
MIKLEHIVLASPEQMEFIIQGMRNPMNSWEKSDSLAGHEYMGAGNEYFKLGNNDHSLMQKLSNSGTDHRKYMRMMPVYARITAPLYWWKEFDTYKVGTVSNSCSTMHKIAEKEFTLENFSTEHLKTGSIICLNDIIDELNKYRDKFINFNSLGYSDDIYDPERKAEIKKDIWWQIIQLLPSSYNQTRNVMMNYEVLANIYKSRKNHKLNEWRNLCDWIESLPYSELIVDSYNQLSACKNDRTCDIRWAEDIFRNRGIKLTMEQINAINEITLQDIKSKE